VLVPSKDHLGTAADHLDWDSLLDERSEKGSGSRLVWHGRGERGCGEQGRWKYREAFHPCALVVAWLGCLSLHCRVSFRARRNQRLRTLGPH